MARTSETFAALSAYDRECLQADILRGELTWRQLQRKYGVPESTLRAHADRHGWVRNATGLKREMVAQMMAFPVPEETAQSAQPAQDNQIGHDERPGQTSQTAQPEQAETPTTPGETAQTTQHSAPDRPSHMDEIEAAAREDARDMRNGLVAARIALGVVGRRLNVVASKPGVFDARETKIMAETVKIAVQTIREIRGLSDPKDAKELNILIKREGAVEVD